MGRLALVIGSVLLAVPAFAQPEIEMEGDPPPQQPPADQPPPTEPPPVVKDPKVAKKWLQAGDKLIKKGDQLTKQGKPEAATQYENAVTAYQKAFEASDDVTILFPLAVALDKTGNVPGAMKHLKQLVAAQGLKADLVKKAQAKLDEVTMKVGIVTLQITPEGTAVALGGKQVGEAPLTEPLVLMPGTHKVSFTAVGFQPKDVDLKVEAGSESERKIALEPVPVVVKPVEPDLPPPKPVEPPTDPSLVPLYIGGGATVGLTLIATVTGIIAVSEHSTFTDPSVMDPDRESARSSGRTFALVTDLCLVGAIGAAAFTTYWYMYRYKPHLRAKEQPTTAKVGIVPWVQPEAGGLVATGSF